MKRPTLKSIVGFLKNPWFLIILGLIAIAIIIWYIGPLISFGNSRPFSSGSGRFLGIGLIGATVGLYQLRRYVQMAKNNKRMLNELAGEARGAKAGSQKQPPSDAEKTVVAEGGAVKAESSGTSKEEVEKLDERFDEAIKILRKAKLGKRKGRWQFMYQLPWYVFIGPPGSGKTTALVNSGLSFPLAKRFGKGKIQGVGGTRNCDWWFTDEAVLLDTAGRYTTQDSDQEVDQAAWKGFLDLLKKHRKRRPINGVLVAISIADLIQQSEDEINAQAEAIKERIQELHDHFEIRFPIYVLFTKMDLLAGFMDFYNDLGVEERNQVWGITFPMDEGGESSGVVERFSTEFDALEKRVNARLIDRLQEERDRQRRDLIYTFPQQFSSVKVVANKFLEHIFRPDRFNVRPLLRGVYFSSGTQEGTPIDRLIGAMSATFGMDRRIPLTAYSGKGRSFFLTRLFKDVVFAESDLAGTNLRWERWRNWLQRGAFASLTIITMLLVSGFVVSCMNNQRYVTAVEQQRLVVNDKAKELSPEERDLLATLPLLDSARDLPGGHRDRDARVPLTWRLGLYQGDKLGSESENVYQRLLQRAFLPRFILYVEEQVKKAASSPDQLYDTFKVYLMLDDSPNFDAATIRSWSDVNWKRSFNQQLTPEQHEEMMAHMDAMLEQGPWQPNLALDQTLIDQAREKLKEIPLSARVYGRLKLEGARDELPPFSISEAAGPDVHRVFEQKNGEAISASIPGLYTYDGYHQYFFPKRGAVVEQLSKETWVIQAETSNLTTATSNLDDEVCRLYLEDYYLYWNNALSNMRIKSFSGPVQAAQILEILSGADSPIDRLFTSVARQVNLDVVSESATEDQSIANRIAAVLSDVSMENKSLPKSCDLTEYSQHFADLTREVKALEGEQSMLQQSLGTINQLYEHMNAIARAAQRGEVPEDLKNRLYDAANQLDIEASRKGQPLNTLLKQLAEDSANAPRGVRERLNIAWNKANVAGHYREKIQGRYPLSKSMIQWSDASKNQNAMIQWSGSNTVANDAGPDSSYVDMDDFGRFFGPDGYVDKFYKKQLSSLVDVSDGVWRWNAIPGTEEEPMSDNILSAFKNAAVIRDSLFQGGGAQPYVRFEMTPLVLDKGLAEFHLELNGQLVSYKAGQTPRTSSFEWPGVQGEDSVRILFSPSRNQVYADKGLWAWFRLLDKARITRMDEPGLFAVTIQIGNNTIGYQVKVSQMRSLFALRELEEFRFPNSF